MKYIVVAAAFLVSVPFSSHACLPAAGQNFKFETKAATGFIAIAGSSLGPNFTNLDEYTLIYKGSQNSCGRTEVYVHTNMAVALGFVFALIALLLVVRRRHLDTP